MCYLRLSKMSYFTLICADVIKVSWARKEPSPLLHLFWHRSCTGLTHTVPRALTWVVWEGYSHSSQQNYTSCI